MKISFHGACREVTGSCVLIETAKTKFLFDCGMFQGEQFASSRNFEDFDFDASEIDFVLLSHAHIDHCGRLPKLYKHGFRGKVYCTDATMDLTNLMLDDSSKIIASEALSHGIDPFYTIDDAKNLSVLFKPVPYYEKIRIASDVSIRLCNSGHILGSSFFEVWITEKGEEKKVVYSGDLGNSPARIIKDCDVLEGADIVFIESTYARDRHESMEDGSKKIRKAIMDCINKGGTLMIPIFALEKSQAILYELNDLVENKKIPHVPMFLDSPLAIRATDIYRRYEHLFDHESTQVLLKDDDLFGFPGMEFTLSPAASKSINGLKPPKVILAGGGMCVGGRIQHHLKFNLDDKNSHVLLVAYQVKGSLGRKLMKGYDFVQIDNSTVPVKAKVSVVNSYSSHADHDGLLKWLKAIKKPKPQQIFIVHGDESSGLNFETDLNKAIKTNIILPEYGKIY